MSRSEVYLAGRTVQEDVTSLDFGTNQARTTVEMPRMRCNSDDDDGCKQTAVFFEQGIVKATRQITGQDSISSGFGFTHVTSPHHTNRIQCRAVI
jgi:hypothetical protein